MSALDAALRAARIAVRQVRGTLVPLGSAARATQALAAVDAHLDASVARPVCVLFEGRAVA